MSVDTPPRLRSAATRQSLQRALRSKLAVRLATAAVAAPMLVLVIFAGGALWTAVVAAALVIAVSECASASRIAWSEPAYWLTAAVAAALPAVALTGDIPLTWPLAAYAIALASVPALADFRAAVRGGAWIEPGSITRRGALGAFGAVYLGLLGSYAVLLRELPQGLEWTLLAIFSVMAVDTGAYAVGQVAGRRPLAPGISPRKTVEGAVGGWVTGFAAVLLINLLPDLQIALWKIVLLGLTLPLIAQMGDLAESAIKRALGIRNFGALLPGHGGITDRLDSLLFGIPAVYLYVQWIVL